VLSSHEQPAHQVRIAGDRGRVSVALDGTELRTVTRAVLTLDAEAVPVLKLSLASLTDIETDLPAHVVLDKPTTRALIAMGWTPPAA
jgi:hypothetical protein